MFLGEFATARDYVERGLSLYEPAHRVAHAEPTAVDVLVDLLGNLDLDLGLPRISSIRRDHGCDASVAEARRLAHAHTLGFALWWGWVAHWFARSDPAGLWNARMNFWRYRSSEDLLFCMRWLCVHRGWSLAALGQANEGSRSCQEGLAVFALLNAPIRPPPGLTMLADAHRSAGQLPAGLATISPRPSAIVDATQIERTSRLKRFGCRVICYWPAAIDPAVAERYYVRSIARCRAAERKTVRVTGLNQPRPALARPGQARGSP